MAVTMRDYIIRFADAESYERGGNKYWQISICDWMRSDKHAVTACSFLDLEAQVRALAVKEGRSVAPSIQLADRKARKPAGFDTFTRSMHVIEYVPVETPAVITAGWTEVEA
jgi:hypothetical protein